MMTAGFDLLGQLPGHEPQPHCSALLTPTPTALGPTLVYVGHEYTQSNLEYAVFADPDNAAVADKLEWCKAKRANGEYTVPSTMQQEP